MNNSKLFQLSVVIRGRVQGVFFRRGVKSEADRLGVFGQAENFSDGSVRVTAEGAKENLQSLLDWCYRGTQMAKVSSLNFTWAPAHNGFKEFIVVKRGNFIEDKLYALQNLSQQILDKKSVLPKHIAIIPDGNRRWAKAHKLQSFKGHEQGMQIINNLLEESLRLKIPYLTLWGFSTENWNRSRQEINFLMNSFRNYLGKLKNSLYDKHVRFRHFGRKDRLPKDIGETLTFLEEGTKDFSKANFGLAVDYGGRDEMLRAIEKCKMENGKISEEEFSHNLDTKDFPDPDLIIRTSGEQRLSGLMPWQGVYSELYFSPVLFPDFDVVEFRRALADFADRKRNFGK